MRSHWHNPEDSAYDLCFSYSNDINVQDPRDGEVFTVEKRGGFPVYFVNFSPELMALLNIHCPRG